jgi:hypothetical protein
VSLAGAVKMYQLWAEPMVRKHKQNVHDCTCEVCRSYPRSETAKEHRAINRVMASLDEKRRRRAAGLLAWQRGWGGIEEVSTITGLSRSTISRGREEVQQVEPKRQRKRVRQVGGGRPKTEKNSRRL